MFKAARAIGAVQFAVEPEGFQPIEANDSVSSQIEAAALNKTEAVSQVVNHRIVLDVARKRIFGLLGEKMYDENIDVVAVKELGQNSFDAIKAKEQSSPPKDYTPLISAAWDRRSGPKGTVQFQIFDNGIGMTVDVIKNALFTIGGTNKNNILNSSGGFGLAKIGIFSAAENIYVESARDGKLNKVNITRKDLLGDEGFDIEESSYEGPSYTNIIIDFPSEINGNKLHGRSIKAGSFLHDSAILIENGFSVRKAQFLLAAPEAGTEATITREQAESVITNKGGH